MRWIKKVLARKFIVPFLVLLVCVCAVVLETGVRIGGGASLGHGDAGAATQLPDLVALVGVAAGWLAVCLSARQINRYALISGIVLSAVGFGLLLSETQSPFVPEFWAPVLASQTAMLKFVLLYGSVVWLRVQASNSAALAHLTAWLMAQGQRSLGLWLPLLGHWLGAAFNVAGLALLCETLRHDNDTRQTRTKLAAIGRGFSVGTGWSPVFASVIVILLAFPQLTWFDIAPPSFLLAMFMFVVGLLVFRPAKSEDLKLHETTAEMSASAFPRAAFVIIGLLLSSIVGFVWLSGASVPLTIGVVVPIFAVLWRISPDSTTRHLPSFGGAGLAGLGRLHSEILMFGCANLLAAGVASYLDANQIQILAGVQPWLIWLSVAVFFASFTLAGVHPLVTVLLIVASVTPQQLGVDAISFAVLIMGLWTTSTIASPMSANTLLLSKIVDQPVWRIAWVWNLPAASLNFAIVLVVGWLVQALAF